jgi:hypothetical protein
MTTEQKISILIRKYGSKSVILDNSSPLSGSDSSFSSNKVLPEQIWVDLKSIPKGVNPLLKSPVNLSSWPPGSSDPVLVKIIKKPLTWIPGTTAFYDPSDPEDQSTVVDIVSPSIHRSYSPYVYVLNTQSNRYLYNISPGEYNWTFDYETGCLVFTDGLPSFMKSPQFQPPAITCYRYMGRKTAVGLSSGLVQGPTGPTGPTGATGNPRTDSIVWKGEYNDLLGYNVNDAVYNDGIVWVKTTGPTGPVGFTTSYFDSITYNELIDGYIHPLNEQYVSSGYSVNDAPYFQSLDDLSNLLSSDFIALGDELKNNDQNINVFTVSGAQNLYSKTFSPYSNRVLFQSPLKMPSTIQVYLEGAGYRLLSIEGLRSSDATITTQSFLNVSRSRLTSGGVINFLANSSVVQTGTSDISAQLTDNLFQECQINLNGSTIVNSCDFHGCTLKIGDPGTNTPSEREAYNGIIHYFKDSTFIDTTFELSYTGNYPNVVIILDRCIVTESRMDAADAGFVFPNRPYPFSLSNPDSLTVKVFFIDTAISCTDSQFNFIDGSRMVLIGTNVLPTSMRPSLNIVGISSGNITQDIELNLFLQRQNSYSSVDPRTTTNFYFNQ